MLINIELNIPQVPELDISSSRGHNRHIDHLFDRRYFDNYVAETLETTSSHNSWINTQLVEIYVAHHREWEKRRDAHLYQFDRSHHHQLLLISLVCERIGKLVENLLTCMYVMRYVHKTNQSPPTQPPSAIIQSLLADPSLSPKLLFYKDFISLTSRWLAVDYWQWLQTRDRQYIIQPEPVIFLPDEQGANAEIVLRGAMEQYGSFFNTLLFLLYTHAPAGTAITLKRWLNKID